MLVSLLIFGCETTETEDETTFTTDELESSSEAALGDFSVPITFNFSVSDFGGYRYVWVYDANDDVIGTLYSTTMVVSDTYEWDASSDATSQEVQIKVQYCKAFFTCDDEKITLTLNFSEFTDNNDDITEFDVDLSPSDG